MSEEVLLSKLVEGLSMVSVLKNVRERSTAKNYPPVSLLYVVSKVFQNSGLLHKLNSYGLSGQIFGLISSFLNNRQL